MTNAELLAEIERGLASAMKLEREHGLEGLVTFSIDEAKALKLALRDKTAVRDEALEDEMLRAFYAGHRRAHNSYSERPTEDYAKAYVAQRLAAIRQLQTKGEG